MKYPLVIGILAFAFSLKAQDDQIKLNQKQQNYYEYEDDFLSPAFHQSRRDSLRALMPEGTAAVLFSAPERNRSNDVYYEYHQDPNFYYLTGLREPNSMLVLFKEAIYFQGQETTEMVFVQERNPSSEIWNGRRLGVDGAIKRLEIQTVLANTTFKNLALPFDSLKRVYFQKPYAMEEQDIEESASLKGLFHHFEQKVDSFSPIAETHLGMMMAKLRQVKTEEELSLLRKAINITCEAQNELMRKITPEMAEYETEAIIEYVFKRNGAEYPGFPSIQGSGENSCILHYTSNRRPLKNGGLLVSDVGAEYHAYTADVTRTIPPDGKFSKEERKVYNLVLEAQKAGIEAAKVGNSFWAPHQAARKVIAEGLVKLGITEKESAVGDYFMHGTSHYLGLDVHDAGMYMPLEAGNVITVEPGIYIAEGSDCDAKWWNIGVRIEDDILIREEGPENLSAASPRTIAEIEALMVEE